MKIKSKEELERRILEKRWEQVVEGKKISLDSKTISEKADYLIESKPKIDSITKDKFNGQYTFKKMIVSGDIIEVYEYEKPVYYGYKDERKTGRKKNAPVIDEDTGEILDYLGTGEITRVKGEEGYQKLLKELTGTKSENRAKTLYRAKKTVLRTANANAKELDKFLTLTFAKNEQDITEANKDFTNFIKRVNRYLAKRGKESLKYIAVIEFQKRGAVHYHLLCNLPYIKKEIIQEIWGNGWIDIKRKRIDGVDNIGAYITKYMQKSLGDERLEGRKCFFKSQNLEEPKEYMLEARIEQQVKKIPVGCKTYEAKFESEHLGGVRYQAFNLSEQYKINKRK